MNREEEEAKEVVDVRNRLHHKLISPTILYVEKCGI